MYNDTKFYFRRPEVCCGYRGCKKIVAKAKYPHKKFLIGDVICAEDFKPTFLAHKQVLRDGDEILCKRCFKRRLNEHQTIPKKEVSPRPPSRKKAWWKFW